jgi:urease accessory protein
MFFGWEVVCLGRPASGDHFAQGHIVTRLELDCRQAQGDEPPYDVPLWRERLALGGDDALRGATFGLRGHAVVASLTATLPPDVKSRLSAESVRTEIGERSDFSVSELDRLLVARYLGDSTQTARKLFERVWKLWRPQVIGKTAVAPRIWAT